MDAKTARSVYGDGSFGGAYRASEDVMHEKCRAGSNDFRGPCDDAGVGVEAGL